MPTQPMTLRNDFCAHPYLAIKMAPIYVLLVHRAQIKHTCSHNHNIDSSYLCQILLEKGSWLGYIGIIHMCVCAHINTGKGDLCYSVGVTHSVCSCMALDPYSQHLHNFRDDINWTQNWFYIFSLTRRVME